MNKVEQLVKPQIGQFVRMAPLDQQVANLPSFVHCGTRSNQKQSLSGIEMEGEAGRDL